MAITNLNWGALLAATAEARSLPPGPLLASQMEPLDRRLKRVFNLDLSDPRQLYALFNGAISEINVINEATFLGLLVSLGFKPEEADMIQHWSTEAGLELIAALEEYLPDAVKNGATKVERVDRPPIDQHAYRWNKAIPDISAFDSVFAAEPAKRIIAGLDKFDAGNKHPAKMTPTDHFARAVAAKIMSEETAHQAGKAAVPSVEIQLAVAVLEVVTFATIPRELRNRAREA
jgi:hypothetical protein